MCCSSTTSTRPARRFRRLPGACGGRGRRDLRPDLRARSISGGDFRRATARAYIDRQGTRRIPASMADVEIYTRMMCGYCAAAKRLLDRQGRRLCRARCELFAGVAPGDDRQGRMAARPFRRSSSKAAMSAVRDELHALDARGPARRDAERVGRGMSGPVKVAALQMRSGTSLGAQHRRFRGAGARGGGQGRDLCAVARDDRARWCATGPR